MDKNIILQIFHELSEQSSKIIQSFYVLDLPRGLLFRDIFVDLFPLTGQTFLFLCVTCDLAIVENWTCELIN